MDKGCFIISGINTQGLVQSVELAVEMTESNHNGLPVPDYVDLNISNKVVKIIQSYVGIISHMIWRKI